MSFKTINFHFCIASSIALIIPLFFLDKFWNGQQPSEAAGTFFLCTWNEIKIFVIFITNSDTYKVSSDFDPFGKSSYTVSNILYVWLCNALSLNNFCHSLRRLRSLGSVIPLSIICLWDLFSQVPPFNFLCSINFQSLKFFRLFRDI